MSIGHLVVNGLLGKAHVVGHGAIDVVLEAVDVVLFAHPVFAAIAEAAVPARHDLLGDQTVAELDTVLPAAFSPSSTTMPTNSWPGIIGSLMYRLSFAAPERFRAE